MLRAKQNVLHFSSERCDKGGKITEEGKSEMKCTM